MRILYYLSHYISHQRAGRDYIKCLQELGHEVMAHYGSGPAEQNATAELAAKVSHADVVIIHEDPTTGIHAALNLQGKRSIAYLPWENEVLSPHFIEPLRHVDEIWTCSEFSRAAFAAHFSKVFVLPHLVERKSPSKEALEWGRDFLRGQGIKLGAGANAPFIFYSIVDAVNPRKNVQALLEAFQMAQYASRQGSKAGPELHLILKEYRAHVDYGELCGVSVIFDSLDDEQMAALQVLSNAYVSAHHSEGWGLGLSEAMAFGRPVLATGYSGNMEFMDNTNSLPLPYSLVPVSEEMLRLVPLFTPEMRWAEVDKAAMAKAMLDAASGRLNPELGRNAAMITKRFGKEAIMGKLSELLSN